MRPTCEHCGEDYTDPSGCPRCCLPQLTIGVDHGSSPPGGTVVLVDADGNTFTAAGSGSGFEGSVPVGDALRARQRVQDFSAKLTAAAFDGLERWMDRNRTRPNVLGQVGKPNRAQRRGSRGQTGGAKRRREKRWVKPDT